MFFRMADRIVMSLFLEGVFEEVIRFIKIIGDGNCLFYVVSKVIC